MFNMFKKLLGIATAPNTIWTVSASDHLHTGSNFFSGLWFETKWDADGYIRDAQKRTEGDKPFNFYVHELRRG